MRLLPASVRARAALSAGAVVLVALVAAGLAVLLTLRASLVREADLQSEVTAREVAAQIAVGTPVSGLRLPDADDHPVQVIGRDGRVLTSQPDLGQVHGLDLPAPSPGVRDNGDDSRDDDFDDHRDEDEPGHGQVSTEVHHRDGTATVEGERTAYRFALVEAAPPQGQVVTVVAGTRPETDVVGTVSRAMLVGLPLLLLVVVAVTWLVTRRALAPVEAIRAEMAEITVAGDLTRRVPVPDSRDEVADLAVTTNQTLAALERSIERQRRFVADASHELRSPIASLRTQVEVADAHPGLLNTGDLLEDIVRLQHLAADLLLLARLDAGERPRPQPVDLAGLVREVLRQRAATDRVPVRAVLEPPGDTGRPAADGGLAARPEAGPADADGPAGGPAGGPSREAGRGAGPWVRGSRGRLGQVLGNLLDNAQRHAAGAVTVTLGTRDGRAVLQVADDGPGVPSAERERIFERFVRLDDARARDEGGAGLGLAIARDIVRAHGGTLTVRDAPAGGALFEVLLPLGGRP